MFSDKELSRRLERAEAEANAAFVRGRARINPQIGATWIDVAGAYAMFDGAESPCTQTFGLGVFDEVTSADLAKIEQFYQDRGAPVFHEVSPLAGLELIALLNERGYQPIEQSSVMYRPIEGGVDPSSRRHPRMQVRPIRKDEGDLWTETTIQGWSHLPEIADYLRELAPLATQRENSISLLVELEDKLIATGAMCLHEGVALLAGACTVPEARRQGAQLALLNYRLDYAAEQGCDIAMMGAQPGSASQRNAERHGFRIAYTRTKWQLTRPTA